MAHENCQGFPNFHVVSGNAGLSSPGSMNGRKHGRRYPRGLAPWATIASRRYEYPAVSQ